MFLISKLKIELNLKFKVGEIMQPVQLTNETLVCSFKAQLAACRTRRTIIRFIRFTTRREDTLVFAYSSALHFRFRRVTRLAN